MQFELCDRVMLADYYDGVTVLALDQTDGICQNVSATDLMRYRMKLQIVKTEDSGDSDRRGWRKTAQGTAPPKNMGCDDDEQVDDYDTNDETGLD